MTIAAPNVNGVTSGVHPPGYSLEAKEMNGAIHTEAEYRNAEKRMECKQLESARWRWLESRELYSVATIAAIVAATIVSATIVSKRKLQLLAARKII